MTTIFAVSSGRPPAAIAVIRCSGPAAFAAAQALGGSLPPPRVASLRTLRNAQGAAIDRALVLCFPGPASATGEDLVEFHCHGGRAVIAAVEAALASIDGLAPAEPGAFTRRALANGRIDLLEAEGLADLLEAETETQRIAAMEAAEGRVSTLVHDWLAEIATLSARIEATLDYAEEDDVAADAATLSAILGDVARLRDTIAATLAGPSVERLRDGVRVVIAGPPNAGKSTLLNRLSEREAAIVSPISGTTRDRIEAPITRAGVPFVIVDTAGLTTTDDPVETIGIARAQEAMEAADVLVWLGDGAPPRDDALWVHARADLADRRVVPAGPAFAISAEDRASVDRLWAAIGARAAKLVATHDDLPALHRHQRQTCLNAVAALSNVPEDALLVAEALSDARRALARLLGLDATEVMLNALFSRFCVGK